jgi:hypothetical protein
MNLHLSFEVSSKNQMASYHSRKINPVSPQKISVTDQFTVQKCFAPFHVQSEKSKVYGVSNQLEPNPFRI